MKFNREEVQGLVEYEGASSWWIGFVSWAWSQEMVANHLIRKVKRKLRNLEEFRHIRTLRENGATTGHIMWAIKQQRIGKERP